MYSLALVSLALKYAMMPAGSQNSSDTAAQAWEYEGMPEEAPGASMMKSESQSNATVAVIAARAAAVARLHEEEHKRTLLEKEAVCASPHALCPFKQHLLWHCLLYYAWPP